MATETYVPDNLIAGDHPLPHQPVTVLAGDLKRGAVLGQVLTGAATSAAKTGGNTGNGTLTVDATAPVKATAKAGVYTVRLIAAATNGGTFRVEDPDGDVIGDVAVGATFDEQIKFATADGATDFVVGDGFDITVAAGAGYRLAAAAAADGSATPKAILAVDVDASGGSQVVPAYFAGQFIAERLTFGAGVTAASAEAAFRAADSQIYIKSAGAAA